MGDTITPFYDPMIAKLIVRGADRDQARARMLQALAQTQAVGVQTNVAFLSRLMRDSAFAAADLDTGLIERQRDTLLPVPRPAGADALALASAAVLRARAWPSPARPRRPRPIPGTRATAGAWAAVPPASCNGWTTAKRAASPSPATARTGPWMPAMARNRSCGARRPMPAAPLPCASRWAAMKSAGTVALHADRAYVFTDAGSHALELYDPLAHSQDTQGEHGGGLTAPMPGKIISIAVKAGDTVEKGQPLLVMEAMKMEHTISAPADGKVAEVFYAIGDQVTEGAELVAIE